MMLEGEAGVGDGQREKEVGLYLNDWNCSSVSNVYKSLELKGDVR